MGLNKRFLYKGPWRKEVGGAESGRRHTRKADWSDDVLEDGRRGHKSRNVGPLKVGETKEEDAPRDSRKEPNPIKTLSLAQQNPSPTHLQKHKIINVLF